MNVFSLGDTFKFRDNKICQLDKVLACDRFMVVTVFMVVTNVYERWDSLMKHIRSCISKADGLLSDENSLRELFYDSIRQWCECHLPALIGLGFMMNANGKTVADACCLISNEIQHTFPSSRNLFSGEKVTISIALGAKKESKKLIGQLRKAGELEVNMYLFLLQSALSIHARNVKL
jgi:hypothetical protein